MARTKSTFAASIPDIHIGRVYDQRDPDGAIHYETFSRLAEFFGRNTPVHRHYSYYQIHLLVSGSIHINLDDVVYQGKAPLMIFTPPNVPHAFYSEAITDGHVLTISQDLVRGWSGHAGQQRRDDVPRQAAFIEVDPLGPEAALHFRNLIAAVELLQCEYHGADAGRTSLLRSLCESAFAYIGRLLKLQSPEEGPTPQRSEDLRYFLQFCDRVEVHFRDHLTLADYAKALHITEARLNDICRRMAQRSSKEVVHERLLQEARRLLQFSATPVTEICYQLGFTDPGYFSRFFTKRAGLPPSEYRQKKLEHTAQ